MRKWLSEFAPVLRLLTIFGFGAAGVHALARGEQPMPPPVQHTSVQVVEAAMRVVDPAVPARRLPPTEMPSADLERPVPLRNDFSRIELSEAILAELSQGSIVMPGLARFEGASYEVATPPASDPLFADETSAPVSGSDQVGGGDDAEIGAKLVDALDDPAAVAAGPLAYTPAHRLKTGAAFATAMSSPEASGY